MTRLGWQGSRSQADTFGLASASELQPRNELLVRLLLPLLQNFTVQGDNVTDLTLKLIVIFVQGSIQ